MKSSNNPILNVGGYEMRQDTFNWFLAHQSYAPTELPAHASPLFHMGLIVRNVETDQWERTERGNTLFNEVFPDADKE